MKICQNIWGDNMKHIYYGLKQERRLMKDNYEIWDLRFNIEHCDSQYSYNFQKGRIERYLKELEKSDNFLIRTHVSTLDKEVFITEKEHEHVLEVGDRVELGKHTGKVLDKRYDAINDVMHYYTDVVLIRIVDENLEERKEEYRLEVLKELKELYYSKQKMYDKDFHKKVEKNEIEENEYDKRNREEIQKAESEQKGFWAWLFGGK